MFRRAMLAAVGDVLPVVVTGSHNVTRTLPSCRCLPTQRCRWFTAEDDGRINIRNDKDRMDSDDDSISITEWVPPKHALAGDKGQSYMYTHVEEAEVLRQIEKELQTIEQSPSLSSPSVATFDSLDTATREAAATAATEIAPVDWLQTRRAVLSGSVAAGTAASLPSSSPTVIPPFLTGSLQIMKPHEASLAKQALVDEIPVKEHMLFTRKEICQILLAMGGQDIQAVVAPSAARYDGGRDRGSEDSNPQAIILVTGMNHAHLRTLAETLIRQLRRRKLHEVGVVGAEQGADGNLKDPNECWFVIDCHNHVVHLQDAKTRKHVNLEGLWSGKDGLYKVNMDDDNAVEDYVAANPVPDGYHGGSSSYSNSGMLGDWDDTLKQLERSRWTAAPPAMSRRAPSSAFAPKRKRKTSGRKT